MSSNSFRLSAYISTISRLFCRTTIAPSMLFTEFGHNINIDNDDYDIINSYYFYDAVRKKKNDNNNSISNGAQLIEPLIINKAELISSSLSQWFSADSIIVMDANIIDVTIEEILPA